jgi:alkaline phosphatase D
MTTTRRHFLRRAGALALSLPLARALSGCTDGRQTGREGANDTSASDDGVDASPGHDAEMADAEVGPLPDYAYDGPLGPEGLFAHGVASGDPLADRVILWTRVSVETATDVFWEMARDLAFSDRVAAGWAVAKPDDDFCVKVDATGLEAGATYYYQFKSLGRTSPKGRTKTAPEGALERMRLAVCSCSNLPAGNFHGYREIGARSDLDLVVHLGDYLYEYGTFPGSDRITEPPHELRTLSDYRLRYAQYRRDRALQEAHRQHPWVVVWDDHEFVNNAARDGGTGHQADDGPWDTRREAAISAWHSWLPVRETPDRHIYRAFRFGDLVHLVMLDTRVWGRDRQVATGTDESVDPARHLLGEAQETWLNRELAGSDARWTVIGQQVMMGQIQIGGVGLNPDQWDGYPAARQRFFDAVKASRVLQNLVVLTGDIHSSWAIDLREDGAPYDPATGAGALGVEIVVPAITSPGSASDGGDVLETFKDELQHILWTNLTDRGYAIVDIDEDRLQAAWHLFAQVEGDYEPSTVGGVFATQHRRPHLAPDTLAPSAEGPPMAD